MTLPVSFPCLTLRKVLIALGEDADTYQPPLVLDESNTPTCTITDAVGKRITFIVSEDGRCVEKQ